VAAPIVFVHGFACTHADWKFQLAKFGAQLDSEHDIFAPDLRGHGRTHARPEDCSIETYGSDIAALLEGRDLKGAVLVGHSMGCRVVLQAYLNAPERVAALALIDGSFQGSRPEVTVEGYPAFARALFEGMFLTPSELGKSIIERAARLPASVGVALFPRMARWDAENMERALAAVKVPLLVIQSTYLNPERKRVALKEGETSPWLEMVRRHAPQAQIELVTGVGHFPQLEAPEQVNELLSGLIER
jgi:pimeloyl-ACP methyl ester carboxylesterase